MCGGFTCSKNALTALNILYILVAFILIGVAVYGRTTYVGANLPTIGGILACGVFLILISILGLVGAIKHHQVLLFFYMIILFLLFCVQFSIACACLAVSRDQQVTLAKEGWEKISPHTKAEIQNSYTCCGFDSCNGTSAITESTTTPNPIIQPPCPQACFDPTDHHCTCKPCMEKLRDTVNYAFKLCGGIGLFFSFTEFLGVWLTVRFRNQKDPRANPSAFL